MSIRQNIKDIVARGNWDLATVEAITNGLATVRLKNNSHRLTNLPVIGSNVKVGDTVIVDRSAEIPTVRRYVLTPEEEQVLLDLADESMGILSESIDRIDIGVHAMPSNKGSALTFQAHSDHILNFGPNEWPTYSADGDGGSMWDSYNMFDESNTAGPTSITIPKTGSYFIGIYANMKANQYQVPWQLATGPVRFDILLNGSTVLLSSQVRSVDYYANWQHYHSALDIVSLTEGDTLSLQVRVEWSGLLAYDTAPSGYYYSYNADTYGLDFMNMTCQFMPGTEDKTAQYGSGGNCFDANPGFIMPTDIPEAEAIALCELYHGIDGDNLTFGESGSTWGTTTTAGGWKGVTVSGGHVTGLSVWFTGGTGSGDLSTFDPSPLTYLDNFFLSFDSIPAPQSGTWNWQWPDSATDIWIDFWSSTTTPDITINFSSGGFELPPNLDEIYLLGDSTNKGINFVGQPPAATTFTALRRIELAHGTVTAGYADAWAEYLYDNWSYITAGSALDIRFNFYGCSDVLSGTYQNATPPTTGKEFQYKLENDPDATGNDLWQFTVTS